MTQTSGTPSARRRTLRWVAAALAGVLSGLYLVVFFVQLPHLHETDNPAPVYAALAVVYVIGAVLLVVRDASILQWIGVAVQVVLVGLFFWLLLKLYENGDQGFILDMLALAVAINTGQMILAGVLAYLAWDARGHPSL